MQTSQNQFACSAWLSLVVCTLLQGCGTNATSTASNSSTPQEIMVDVLKRYQTATAYSDEGEAMLRVRDDQGTQTQTAPLQVQWSRSKLVAQAYAVTLTAQSTVPTSIDLTAWFNEPETSHFDRQVLKQTISTNQARPQLDALLTDEVLRSRLSAGLAGPPPQLEWLFAPQPMLGLFESSSQFVRLSDANIGEQTMQRIEVRRENDRYVFWIEPQEKLIHRVELPVPEHVFTSLGVARSGATLWLDLHNATWTPKGDDALTTQPSFTPRWVSRLIPMPPPPPSPVIGRSIPMGWLQRLKMENKTPSTLILVIHCPDDLRQLEAIVPGLMPYADQANPKARLVLASQTNSISEWIRSTLGSELPLTSDEDVQKLLRDLRCPPGAMVLLHPEGQVLLVESQISPATFANMAAAIIDQKAGIPVPERIMRDYKQLTTDYQAALDSVSISTNNNQE